MPTAISMTQDDADRFSDELEAEGFITEHVQLWDFSEHVTKQIVLRTSKPDYREGEKAVWDIWTDEGWSRWPELRRRFQPLAGPEHDDEDDED